MKRATQRSMVSSMRDAGVERAFVQAGDVQEAAGFAAGLQTKAARRVGRMVRALYAQRRRDVRNGQQKHDALKRAAAAPELGAQAGFDGALKRPPRAPLRHPRRERDEVRQNRRGDGVKRGGCDECVSAHGREYRRGASRSDWEARIR